MLLSGLHGHAQSGFASRVDGHSDDATGHLAGTEIRWEEREIEMGRE